MVTILIGIPASGKSTYCESIKNAVILSSDKIREELYSDASTQGNPKDVFDLLYSRMEEALSSDNDVIIDATNITKKDRSKAITIARQYHQSVKAVVFKTSIAECIRRNDARDRKVPDFVFDHMIYRYESPTVEEGFSIIEVVK